MPMRVTENLSFSLSSRTTILSLSVCYLPEEEKWKTLPEEENLQ